MTCDAKIRPFRPVNQTELQCELDHTNAKHQATLRDYAYPGSATMISWLDEDRRTFRGDFQQCTEPGCLLPLEHGGNHAD